jgi:pimeloyl-ACP methyl ester carboxylesterase
MKEIQAGRIVTSYFEFGPEDGPAVVLLHGFPYDVHAYDEVSEHLAEAGCRCIVPYLRGFGSTRFIDPATPRSGEQAALGADLIALLDALDIEHAVLAGYDWGGRAACVVSALWPERVIGLVSCDPGYNIQNIAGSSVPLQPQSELPLWYQYYLHSDRGYAGLASNRNAFCRLLWGLWSPSWRFDDATFNATADAFNNPDFVDVVVHSYRHRFGLVEGDPAYALIEQSLSKQPPITVPTVVLAGADDGVSSQENEAIAMRGLDGPVVRQVLVGVGHNVPQEAPVEFSQAVLSLLTMLIESPSVAGDSSHPHTSA